MELTTHLSRDRFGWMQRPLRRRDHALMLVRVAATLPEGVADIPVERVPTRLVVVLDRSGSMGGARLEHAKRALRDVVTRLSPGDSFGLVTFDTQVDVVVPVGPVHDAEGVRRRIDAIAAGGGTDLGAGLVRGLEEARRLDVGAGVRVLLVSDGHANVGVTDPDTLGGRVGVMRERGITTSTLGVGLGYDEMLLSAVARAGSGNEHFAAEADAAGTAIAAECGELAEQRFLSCRLTIAPATGIRAVDVVNDAAVTPVPGGVTVDLGGMTLGETRSIVVECAPHEATRPGRRKVAKVRLDHVLADDLSDHHVSTTVWTNVIRPDERDGVVDRHVVGEWYLQRVLRRKRHAMRALAAGDVAEAVRLLQQVVRLVQEAAPSVPRAFRDELVAEAEEASHLAETLPSAGEPDRSHVSKLMSTELHVRSRRRR